MSTTNIILLHLWILASQVFYMYLSNKTQLKTHAYLYLIAIPIVAAFPVILNSQDPHAYSLYEYAIVFCIVFAAVIDSSLAAVRNREYMTDSSRSFIYSYLLICTVIVFMGSTSITVRIVPAFLLLSSILLFCLAKKNPAAERIKSIPLALLSVLCSWAYIAYSF